ncbi:MAG: mechanosensitive ion channel, partial [Myxococcales bacterium]|nr:mechanosensitive ion channel [Myxococcales bacterium]
ESLPWDPARTKARLSRVDGNFSGLEATMAEARAAQRSAAQDAPWQRVMDGRVEAYEHALAGLAEERRLLKRTEATYELVEALQGARAPRRPWPLTALFLVAAVVAGLLLLTRGPSALRLFLAPSGRLGLSEERSAQAEALMLILWPLGVLLGTAAVIVWPILGLQVTVIEAIKAVDLPLFYVEDRPVSALSLVEFVVTVWAAVVISRWLRRFLTDRVYPRTGWDIGLTNAFNTLAHYLVLVVGMVVGLRFVGVGFSSLAILAGVLGIGIGFGLRNITENFISGLIILAERPIKIGDFIEVKDGSVEGRVESIRARSTTVVTRDNISMIIPNSEFVARPVVNWSHGDPKVRVGVPVGVAYGSDTDLVRKVLLEVAGRHGKVLKKPAPEVQFRAFGSSSLDFMLLLWIEEQQHRFRIASDIHFAVDKAFRKFGIEIAFPQTDIHFKTVGPGFMTALGSPSGPPTPELASERPRAGAMSRRPHRETGADEDGSAPTRPVPPSDE